LPVSLLWPLSWSASSNGAVRVDDIIAFFSKWTPGGVGIWTLVAMLLIAWWQGLPKLLDAITNRQSKIEERMQDLLDKATERFERELAAADKRHGDCMAANDVLAGRINEQEKRLAGQASTIAEQGDQLVTAQRTIDSLKKQIVQMQASALRVATHPSNSGLLEPMLEQLAAVEREDSK